MATTSIRQITRTVDKAIAYITADKTEPLLREGVSEAVNYDVDDRTGKVVYKTLTSTFCCANPGNPSEDFARFANYFGKDSLTHGCLQSKNGSPILAWHLVQSFDGDVDPRTANEIGRKLAQELFDGHPAVISTHTNTENIHNHILVSAWNFHGIKWHNCHATYREIRSCSDRLCEEYGLEVLDKTRDQVLVRWTDKQGKTRYFEPTKRKKEQQRKRKDQKISPDDVGSYRNSFSYEISEKRRDTSIAIIKADIDELLPYARTYEQLLALLLERGYKINSHKKNGQWLKYITFTAPMADKGVRDASIGEEYSRERIAARIAEQNRERQRSSELQEKLHLPIYEAYEYKEADIQGLNEDYRGYYMRDGSVIIEERSDAEKTIIRNVKKMDLELNGIHDTTYIYQVLDEQRKTAIPNTDRRRREERLVRQIQESFQSLRFVESKGICNCQEVEDEVHRLQGLLEKGEKLLEKAERESLRLEDEKAFEYRERAEELSARLDAVAAELKNYEQCLTTLKRIASERDRPALPSVPQQKKKAIQGYER